MHLTSRPFIEPVPVSEAAGYISPFSVFPSPLFLDTSKCSLFQCLIVLVFEVHRRLVLQRAVEPAPVVNGFNVFENHTPQPVLGPVGTLLQSLAFERAPERFHRRVVVAVGFSAHAGDQAAALQLLAVSPTGILDASI